MKFFGMLYIITAPSGAGKSTLIRALMEGNCYLNDLRLSISYTTRVRRPGEVHGEDYYFISIEEFKRMIHANLFLEYAKVFNCYYGTAKSNIKDMLNAGMHVILDIDWNGVKQIRDKISSNVYTIFILPPSQKELKYRLRCRSQDSEQVIALRMKKSIEFIKHIVEYDFIVVNDNFDVAFRYLQSIILSEQLRFAYQSVRYKNLINNLLKSD